MDSRLFAEAVVASFGASAARADIETRGDDAVAVIEPSNAGACSLRVTYQPERELVALLLGEDEVLVELSLTGPVEWPDVQPWIAPRAQAVFDGRYEQVRTTLRDGTLVAVVGTFHLEDEDVRHVYRRRLGWFRRKQRSRITFAAYG